MRNLRSIVTLGMLPVSLSIAGASAAAAQSHLEARCVATAQPADRGRCDVLVQAADILLAKVGLAAAGGNPVPGTGSTLGMSLGPLPRISLAGRATTAWLSLPALGGAGADDDFLLVGFHVDGSVGIFQGFSPSATVGGLGALDLLASAGFVRVPDEGELQGANVFTWSVGARFGITRESFTAPGVSLSLMYRGLGAFRDGDDMFAGNDASLIIDDASLWSFRAVVGKRLTSLGLTAGIGYDRYSSGEADASFSTITGTTTGAVAVIDDYAAGRWNAFVDGSFTMLVFSATAELGWQLGGDAPAGRSASPAADGRPFASFALRLAL